MRSSTGRRVASEPTRVVRPPSYSDTARIVGHAPAVETKSAGVAPSTSMCASPTIGPRRAIPDAGAPSVSPASAQSPAYTAAAPAALAPRHTQLPPAAAAKSVVPSALDSMSVSVVGRPAPSASYAAAHSAPATVAASSRAAPAGAAGAFSMVVWQTPAWPEPSSSTHPSPPWEPATLRTPPPATPMTSQPPSAPAAPRMPTPQGAHWVAPGSAVAVPEGHSSQRPGSAPYSPGGWHGAHPASTPAPPAPTTAPVPSGHSAHCSPLPLCASVRYSPRLALHPGTHSPSWKSWPSTQRREQTYAPGAYVVYCAGFGQATHAPPRSSVPARHGVGALAHAGAYVPAGAGRHACPPCAGQ